MAKIRKYLWKYKKYPSDKQDILKIFIIIQNKISLIEIFVISIFFDFC